MGWSWPGSSRGETGGQCQRAANPLAPPLLLLSSPLLLSSSILSSPFISSTLLNILLYCMLPYFSLLDLLLYSTLSYPIVLYWGEIRADVYYLTRAWIALYKFQLPPG